MWLATCSNKKNKDHRSERPNSPAEQKTSDATPNSEKKPDTPASEPESSDPSIPATPSSLAAGLAKSLRGKSDFMIGVGNTSDEGYVAGGGQADLYYAYLCCGYGSQGWRDWNPDGLYVDKVVAAAAKGGATPVFTYYQLALEFEQRNYAILTSPYISQYLNDIKVMFSRLAVANTPAIVHLEPDLFGYLRQYSLDIGKEPDAIAVTFHTASFNDCDHLPETTKGLIQCIIHMARTMAPKTKVGLHASRWGDWYDDTDPTVNPFEFGEKAANFLMSVGAQGSDLVVVETLDRDAGFWEVRGGRGQVYWDETNQTLPNFKGHFSWVKGLTTKLGKPALWWQTPLGVPSTTPGGTDGHYRDNRVKYFFSHIGELIDAGGVGVMFGAGAGLQTTMATDGDQLRNAMAEYFKNPVKLGP